jgi:hypothetical protein
MFQIIENDQRAPFVGCLTSKIVDRNSLIDNFYYVPWINMVEKWLDSADTTLALYSNETYLCCVIVRLGVVNT